MSFSPLTTAVAKSTPYDDKFSGLNAKQIQEAIDKLTWLLSIQDFIDENGNFCFKLGTPVIDFITVINETEKVYNVYVNNSGELITEQILTFAGQNDAFRLFKTPSGELSRINVNDNGELLVLNDSESIDANRYSLSSYLKKVILKSSNNTNWALGVNNDNDIVVESTIYDNGFFKIINQRNEVLFDVHSNSNGSNFAGRLNELHCYDSTNLPQSPSSLENYVPWAMFDNQGIKLPVYFDGNVWRYFYNNQSVGL